MTGTLYIVATPIGNLADASPRSLETLRAADLIACEDTRTSAKLLAHYGIGVRTVALHEHNERTAAKGLIQALREGKNKIDPLFSKVEVRAIEEAELRKQNFSPAMFRNLNTPEELQQASKI